MSEAARKELRSRLLNDEATSWVLEMVARGDERCPSVLKTMHEWIFDDAMLVTGEQKRQDGSVRNQTFKARTSDKIKFMSAATLLKIAALREGSLRAQELSKPRAARIQNAYVQVNLSYDEFQQLPEPIRAKLMAQELAAKRAPAQALPETASGA